MKNQPAPPYRRANTVPAEVLSSFDIEARNITRLGIGHINETFVVTDREGARHLLQAINHDVFSQPDKVMGNLEKILDAMPEGPLSLRRSESGECVSEDNQARHWRAFPFLGGTVTHTAPRNTEDVYRTAAAFGHFQVKLADLDPRSLNETIPRFHDTPHRYQQLQEAIATDRAGRVSVTAESIALALSHQHLARRLIDLQAKGLAPVRVVHNDAKISNVLFDEKTEEAVCVVDLDTVMAGLSLYDFGDMVRSMCHTTEEDETNLDLVVAQRVLYEALAAGFLDSTQTLLNKTERAHLFDAGLVLVLEQGVRFLADHLNGDRYFRTQREGHNLDRAHTQFRLLESLLEQAAELRRLH